MYGVRCEKASLLHFSRTSSGTSCAGPLPSCAYNCRLTVCLYCFRVITYVKNGSAIGGKPSGGCGGCNCKYFGFSIDRKNPTTSYLFDHLCSGAVIRTSRSPIKYSNASSNALRLRF